jgi:hypothetical protein
MQVAQLGGNANNGLQAGAWNWNVNNDASNSNRNIGPQPAVKKYKILFTILSFFSCKTFLSQKRKEDK